MPVEIEDSDLLHVVNALINGGTGEEAKPWSDESEKTRILTVLVDRKEMLKGRQKELSSLKDMSAMTVVKRSEAVGKQMPQTRWVDREKDGCVKSRLVLTGLQSKSGAYSARDVLTDTIDTVSENNVGCKFT